MCVKTIFVVHVAEAEFVQFSSIATACGIDGEEDWPCYANTGKANENGSSQEPQVEIGVER